MGCYLLQLCILLCTCFLLLLLLNFHFYFLFFLRKTSCEHSSPLSASSQSISSISYLLSFCHKICWDFLQHLFSFNTEFFLWLLLHRSHLTYLCIITKNINIFLNSVNLLFTWALSIQYSSYFLINNVMFFDLVLNFETQTVPNFRTHIIFKFTNLTIVVIFGHNIFIIVFISSLWTNNNIVCTINLIQIISLKVFHLFLNQWYGIDIIWNNVNPNTQKVCDKCTYKFLSYLSDFSYTAIV